VTDPSASTAGESASTAGRERRIEAIRRTVLPDLDRNRAALQVPVGDRTANRRVESSLPPRWHPLPVPNGWYAILGSDEVDRGAIVSIGAVDRDLVVFRDEHGVAHVVDAYCAHMGAHLGGGVVVDATIRCPYHGWRYAGDGRCVDIPYCDTRIPGRARVRSYPVDEKDGFIYFWYHAGDAPADYEVPSVGEVVDPGWTDPQVFRFELVAALQEMAENNVDYAHFRYVHGRDGVPINTSQLHFDGPRSWVDESLPEGVTFTRHSYGPGVAVLRFPELMTIVATTTPIDRGNCRLLWHFFFPIGLADAADDLILGVTGPYGLQADVPIWRDMKYRERPVLVKGDGPIAEYRKWYAQFYDGN
jgi:nitrite reductase/ring-hydroxylating ferredoxin subunit